jgi:peptidoglycan-associated lipoprotein
MMTRKHARSAFVVAAIGASLLLGCAGRKVTTAVEDQAFLPPAAPASEAQSPAGLRPAEAARVAPPAAIKETPAAPPPQRQIARAEPVPTPPMTAPPSIPDLSDSYFDYDQFTIRSDAQRTLEVDARVLKAKPGQAVLIEGHCDERGTMAYNLVLGERRAKAAQRYLQDLGVTASQLQVTSYGKERPFCTDHSEACWQSNRRAHFGPR